ncbi:hypothetical protein FVEG_14937 [Fusarium verticillioides 7600]|uniref:Conserved oligomeric Golgi complex subunit 4 C-terminal domain-containing protein n=1 Tax=Gibberella moniliformis (strain M3125 / FGSC 7600) TaxID=334819 RepID=W7LJJ7_GIBM7|nr:hypothetical protein FVEG_14937 [Fusarium verticillioides 7600]EWG38661.1 hypothetical protein FVEG_14937 [Fusarium verticillioides 7600]RBQ68939.1 hypothetical protein FVER14953_20994 [Fusarium verticillioides]
MAMDNYALREPFTRLQESPTLANMEGDEWDELESGYESSKQERSKFLSDEEMIEVRKIVRR